MTLAYLDRPTRTVGWGPTFELSGDVAADMDRIRAFYADKRGIRPELTTRRRGCARRTGRQTDRATPRDR